MSRLYDNASTNECMYLMACELEYGLKLNSGAYYFLIDLDNRYPNETRDILILLDKMRVYGHKIYMLWNDCCNRDYTKLFETINMIKAGKITTRQLYDNLNRVRAIPFI